MNSPKFSVVTVCYNSVNEIEKTILSVLQQNNPSLEYIIIDGGSNDGTIDIIKKYSDFIAYWISEPDEGIYDAMNKSISVAKGEFLIFMNAGDQFFSNSVTNSITPYFNSDKDVYYGNI